MFEGLRKELSKKKGDEDVVPVQIIEYHHTKNKGNKRNNNGQLNRTQRQSTKAAPKYFDPESLFEEAKRRDTNFVGVIGEGGIGKTVLTKDLANNYAAKTPSTDGPFVFYIPLKGVDFLKRVNVLRFLVTPLLPDWAFEDKQDERLTRMLNESSDVYIFIDGLDEMDGELLKKCPRIMSLCDSCIPAVIMKNLFNGSILPNAKKLVSSRPAAFLHLHHECKPKFNVRILGFSQEAQRDFCSKVCENGNHCDRVMEALDLNHDLSAISYVPFFLKLIVRYLKQRTSTFSQTTTLTDLFTETLARYVRSPHRRSETESLKKLIELAMTGLKEDRFTFRCDEIPGNSEYTKDFFQAEVQAVSSPHLREDILEGDKSFSFIHTLWQEYFAALQLMFFENSKTILSSLDEFEEERWDTALRFAFGFQKGNCKQSINSIFPSRNPDLFPENTEHLKELVLGFIDDGFIVEPCIYALEAQNQSLTEEICSRFPEKLVFSEIYDSMEFMAISYALRCQALTPRQIYMWDFKNSFVFRGSSLKTLLAAVNDNGHKVRKTQLPRKTDPWNNFLFPSRTSQ